MSGDWGVFVLFVRKFYSCIFSIFGDIFVICDDHFCRRGEVIKNSHIQLN